ncbi:MerR family transcriptional regulator [Alicyclobacillus shizuokensis]|uniref:MerR family transcriptional regulator n=1 Tax=Alicyclobacillus shizuokensis TaxID=392014 RepID=UPI00082B79D3|nr:MerR family transcriptional regulator [Alicyclobacillus shizuokensis]
MVEWPELEYVTLGDAAEILKVPAPTLRGWADKLEELGVHMLQRNHRKERIFTKQDLEIFEFIKQQKDLYGRKTTTVDLAMMVKNRFECRSVELHPELTEYQPRPDFTPATAKAILEHEGFQQLMNAMVNAAAEKAVETVREEMEEERRKFWDEYQRQRAEDTDFLLNKIKENKELYQEIIRLQKRPLWKRLFGKE